VKTNLKSELFLLVEENNIVSFDTFMQLPFLPSRTVADDLRRQLAKLGKEVGARFQDLGFIQPDHTFAYMYSP